MMLANHLKVMNIRYYTLQIHMKSSLQLIYISVMNECTVRTHEFVTPFSIACTKFKSVAFQDYCAIIINTSFLVVDVVLCDRTIQTHLSEISMTIYGYLHGHNLSLHINYSLWHDDLVKKWNECHVDHRILFTIWFIFSYTTSHI